MRNNSFYERPLFLMIAAGVGFFLLSFIAMGLAPWTSLKTVTTVSSGDSNPYYESDGKRSSIGRGRDIYIQEACWHCHSQFVRPVAGEPFRYGPPSKAWENRFDIPQLYGTRRVGPDLSREAGRRSDDWHYAHLYNPRSTTPLSVMPAYRWFFDQTENGPVPNQKAKDVVAYLQYLGSHYKEDIQQLVYPRLFKVSGFPLATGETLDRGQLLFAENCAGCHGPGADGNGQAKSFLRPAAPSLVKRFVSTSEVYSILNRGVLGSAMPSFREMPAQDLWALSEYVSKLGGEARTRSQTLLGEKKKLVAKGKDLYQVRCAVCHGASGAGDGATAAALNPRPKDFTRRAFDPEYFAQILTSGVPGSSMPPFPMSSEEREALTTFVASLYQGDL